MHSLQVLGHIFGAVWAAVPSRRRQPNHRWLNPPAPPAPRIYELLSAKWLWFRSRRGFWLSASWVCASNPNCTVPHCHSSSCSHSLHSARTPAQVQDLANPFLSHIAGTCWIICAISLVQCALDCLCCHTWHFKLFLTSFLFGLALNVPIHQANHSSFWLPPLCIFSRFLNNSANSLGCDPGHLWTGWL